MRGGYVHYDWVAMPYNDELDSTILAGVITWLMLESADS